MGLPKFEINDQDPLILCKFFRLNVIFWDYLSNIFRGCPHAPALQATIPDLAMCQTSGRLNGRGDRFFDEVAASTASAKGGIAGATSSTPSDSTSCGAEATSPPSMGQKLTTGLGDAAEEPQHPLPRIPVPYLRMQGLKLASGFPAFTNFTPEFTEPLDYVFIEGKDVSIGGGNNQGGHLLEIDGDEGRESEAVAPMPEEETLRRATPGLPSETFPSDHISLVVDLRLDKAV